MQQLKRYLWQNLGIRLLLGWLLIAVLPALVFFWQYIIVGDWALTRINSVIAGTLLTFLSFWALEKFSKFPGQRSVATILPIVFALSSLTVLVLFIFRLPYSVYYLTAAFVIAIIFFFVAQLALRAVSKPVMAYIPLGRCIDLPNIDNISWLKLNKNTKNEIFDAVVADLADDALDNDWEHWLAETALRGVPIYNVLQVQESLTGRLPIKHLYENTLGSLQPSPFYLLLKRIMDSSIILLALPLVVPISLLVALAIKWESRGSTAPVFFTQKRIGQGGKIFTMYKFRSMIPTSEKDGAQMASSGDRRITPFGRFIRKMRLDELPQFYNVLKGDMSLIGPRPEQPDFVEQFNDSIPFYRYRHIVKPGISGWAQVVHGYAGDEDETRVKLEHDFYYIKNFSLTLDLLIVIKTIQTMLTGFGAR